MALGLFVRGLPWAVLGVVFGLSGCDREHRPLSSMAETGPRGVVVSELQPGTPVQRVADPRAQGYEGNAGHISNGQQYYKWFNCSGCHFNGGGGIGPALMDDQWRYGGSIEQVYASIAQGRPNGMPAFKDKIPETQIWEIAAFVRALSGNADRLAAPTRGDEMRSTGPINNQNPTPERGDPAAAKSGTTR